MHRKIKLVMEIPGTEDLLESVIKALEPDNRPLPSGMDISTKYCNGRLVIEIVINEKLEVLTLRNTADELLELISMLFKLHNSIESEST